VNPRSSVQEGTHFISENTLEFRAAISLDTEQMIKRVQDLLCQSKGRVVSFDEALREMAKLYLDKNDPVVRAQRVLSKAIKKENTSACIEKSSTPKKDSPQRPAGRKPLSQELKNQVLIRDLGRCQGKVGGSPDDNICGDTRWLDVHHLTLVSEGGKDILENLVTLCKGHHVLEHIGEANSSFS
jgi:hypothetical protein